VHRNFVDGTMWEEGTREFKPVTACAGVGEACAAELKAIGLTKALQLLVRVLATLVRAGSPLPRRGS
jgi:hypothetical protein